MRAATLAGLATLLLLACGDSSGGAFDATVDTGIDAGMDVTVVPDAAPDAIPQDTAAADVVTTDAGADADAAPVDDTADADDAVDAPASPSISAIAPTQVSARGGALVTLSGDRFEAPVTVTVRDTPAQVVAVAPHMITFATPRLVAGPADVSVTVAGVALPTLDDALTIAALSLTYAFASQDTVAAPEAPTVRGAAAFDVERDGDLDLVVATSDGLRVLLNDGAGRLSLLTTSSAGVMVAAAPGGHSDVRAVVAGDIDGDDAPELVACTAAARELIMGAGATGLQPAWDLAYRDGACVAAALTGQDVKGTRDVTTLVDGLHPSGGVGLVVWREGHDLDLALTPPDPQAEPETQVGTASSNDPDALPTMVRRVDQALSTGVAALAFSLTELGPKAVFTFATDLPDVPDALQWRLRGLTSGSVDLRPRVTDHTGAHFVGPSLSLGLAWASPVGFQVAGWEPQGGDPDAVPSAPIVAVSLVADGGAPDPEAPPAVGNIDIDWIVARPPGRMHALVAGFDRLRPQLSWPDAIGLAPAELDGDGLLDLVVTRATGAPLLLLTGTAPADGPYSVAVLPVAGPGPYRGVRPIDADGDGRADLLVTGVGQDRLLVGDGWGRFVDATLGALPVDGADGVCVAAADLDLDGAVDLVVGNRAATDRWYLGRGDGRFLDATPSFGFDAEDTAAVVIADLDGDGDDDIVSVPVDGTRPVVVRVALEAAP